MRVSLQILLVTFSLATLFACVHKPFPVPAPKSDVCLGVNTAFQADIQPILRRSCAKAGCHDGVSMPHDFSVYTELKPILDDSSFYYYVLKDRSMPQDTALPEEALSKIRCWAAQHYPNN